MKIFEYLLCVKSRHSHLAPNKISVTARVFKVEKVVFQEDQSSYFLSNGMIKFYLLSVSVPAANQLMFKYTLHH